MTNSNVCSTSTWLVIGAGWLDGLKWPNGDAETGTDLLTEETGAR